MPLFASGFERLVVVDGGGGGGGGGGNLDVNHCVRGSNPRLLYLSKKSPRELKPYLA